MKEFELIEIRRTRQSDASSLLSFVREVMQDSEEFLLTAPEEFTVGEEEEKQWIASFEGAPSSVLYVAVVSTSDEIVGVLDFKGESKKRLAHLGYLGISVKKDYRGRGIGEKLLKTLIDWAITNPLIEKLNLKVHATNTSAIHLYKKCGFKEEGRQIKDLKYGPDNYVDTIIMGRFIP